MEETKVTRDTKEEILITALHRFARDGYEAVSVSQIAGDLGITKGALYRHYKNKRDIFDHIVARMEQGDSDQAESHDMPEGDKESMPEKYEEVSLDDFVQYSRSMFEYWTEDDFASAQFYAIMFLYYSLYDGASDRKKIKKQFGQAISEFAKNLQV